MLRAIAIILFLLILGAVGAFGYYFYAKPSRMLDQLENAKENYSHSQPAPRERSALIPQLLRSIGTLLPLSPQDTALARRELVAAGIRSESAIQVLFGLKLLLAGVLLSIALIFRYLMCSTF
jgi:hypothetical protein